MYPLHPQGSFYLWSHARDHAKATPRCIALSPACLAVTAGRDSWSKPNIKGTPPSPRDSHTCTAVGHNLYVFGGTDGACGLNDLYMLDTSKLHSGN